MTNGFVDPVEVHFIGDAEIALPNFLAAPSLVTAFVTAMSILVHIGNWLFCPRRRTAGNDAG